MNNEDSKIAKQVAFVALLIIICVACGYYFGNKTAGIVVESKHKVVVDSLTTLLRVETEENANLYEDLDKDGSYRQAQIDKIDSIIKKYSHEIKTGSENIFYATPGDHVIYVDSIRKSTGFYKIRY